MLEESLTDIVVEIRPGSESIERPLRTLGLDFLHQSLLVDLPLVGLIEECLVRILLSYIDIVRRFQSYILGLLRGEGMLREL